MSDPKFTPRPWKRAINLSRNGSGKPRGLSPSRIVDAANRIVAYAYRRISGAEQTANAALIAAAPEMYEMLENILNDCGVCVHTVPIDGYTTPYQRIKEVLRKARGESEVSE